MVEASVSAGEGYIPDTDEVGLANRSVRRGSLIAGLSLLVMTPLAAFANFGVLEALITPGNAAQTANAILNAEGTFRSAIASLFLVAVLDLTVAWGLYAVFEPVSRGIALLMAWFRVVFAGIFVVAISQLTGVLSILTTAGSGSAFSTEQHYAQALLGINAFYGIWDAALILVGLHLVLLGYLVYRSGTVPSYKSGYVPKVLGVLLAIAGVGYVIDIVAFGSLYSRTGGGRPRPECVIGSERYYSFGRVLVTGYSFEVAAFTFVGEVLLIFWLFIYGRRIGLGEKAASIAD